MIRRRQVEAYPNLMSDAMCKFPLGNIGKKNKGFEGIAWMRASSVCC